MTRWVLTHPARPWSINVERRWHPHKRAAAVKLWRTAFYHLAVAHQVPPATGPLQMVVHVRLRGRRTMDAANYLPAVKAAVDGLVDAGVIPDDSPQWVSRYVLHAPVNEQTWDGLTLIIEEACATPTHEASTPTPTR